MTDQKTDQKISLVEDLLNLALLPGPRDRKREDTNDGARDKRKVLKLSPTPAAQTPPDLPECMPPSQCMFAGGSGQSVLLPPSQCMFAGGSGQSSLLPQAGESNPPSQFGPYHTSFFATRQSLDHPSQEEKIAKEFSLLSLPQ